MKPKMIVILVLLLLLLVILAFNTHEVTLSLLFWSISLPLFLWLAFSVLLGFIIGYLVCLSTHKKKAPKGRVK